MPSKKKSVDEARTRLQEKLNDVKSKANNLHSLIDTISKEAVNAAETSLKETNKSKFLHSYSKVSQELEQCMNKFLLLSDALENLEESDEEEGESDDEADGTKIVDDGGTNDTLVSSSAKTIQDVDDDVGCIPTDDESTRCFTDVTFPSTILPETDITSNVDAAVRKRSNSRESLFSSVSMQCHSTPLPRKYPLPLDKDIMIERYKWEPGVGYPVLVTNFISPWEFHVQLVNPENDIMEQMCISFMKEATQGYRGGIDVLPVVGMFCCAKFTDETWYRAKVVDVVTQGDSSQDFEVKVFYVDEGFYSVVGPSHLRPLEKKFASKFPSQSFHCVLGGVQPISALHNKDSLGFKTCCNLWTTESKDWFQNQMDLGLFNAYFYYPPKAAYAKPHLLDTNVLVCDLFVHAPDNNCKLWKFSYERPKLESHLGFQLIANRFAAHCAFLESELNRKKSQRVLKDAMSKTEDSQLQDQAVANVGSKETSNLPELMKMNIEIEGATASTSSFFPRENKCSKSTASRKDITHSKSVKEDVKSKKFPRGNIAPKKSPREDIAPKKSPRKDIAPIKSQREEKCSSRETCKGEKSNMADKKPSTNENRNNSKSKTGNDKRNKKEKPISPSSLLVCANDKRNIDITPMQIEVLPNVKNAENLVVQSNGRVSSPISVLGDADSGMGVSTSQGTPIPDPSVEPSIILTTQDKEDGQNNINLIKDQFVFSDLYEEMTLDVKKDSFLKVFVSEIVNPGLFYVHLVSPQAAKLDEMMDSLNAFYRMNEVDLRQQTHDSPQYNPYEEGIAVVALFSEDDRWYRGLIVSKCCDDNESSEDSYNVLYVDYGNNAVVPASKILPVCEEFCELPMETIPCCLADVSPTSPFITSERGDIQVIPAGDESSDEEGGRFMTDGAKIQSPPLSPSALSRWSEISITVFKKVSLINLPLLAALKVSEKNDNGLYELYLYDTTDDHDVFINQYLVDEGVVTSKVFSKTTPVVQISENDLEQGLKSQGEMSTWDPMKEQYFSKRNAYSVDVNDPAVAMLGYVEKQQDICHQYLRGRCYRGSACRFAHVLPGDMPMPFEEVFCADEIVKLPELGDWVPISVTACMHPAHFWVNFPYGAQMFSEQGVSDAMQEINPLIELNETMNNYYNQSKRKDNTDLTILAEGELVAAKFQEDWYRARVVNVAEDLVQVFYVDYGNTAVISDDCVRKLVPDFLHAPLQAVECSLNGVELESGLQQTNLILYNELRLKLKELTADKLLIALVVARSPRKDLVLDLYDTSTTPHICLNKTISAWNGMNTSKAVPNCTLDLGKKQVLFPG